MWNETSCLKKSPLFSVNMKFIYVTFFWDHCFFSVHVEFCEHVISFWIVGFGVTNFQTVTSSKALWTSYMVTLCIRCSLLKSMVFLVIFLNILPVSLHWVNQWWICLVLESLLLYIFKTLCWMVTVDLHRANHMPCGAVGFPLNGCCWTYCTG
jgi:hypothetical protein